MLATIFIKTILIYIFVLIAVRMMGKRELGQLQPFELVVFMMIADVASVPMQSFGLPILHGIIPILAILMSELIISYLNIKFPLFHKMISGKPAVLIEKGKINEKNLSKQKYSIDDLLEQIRVAGYSDIRDVDYAILEMSGEISIIPKPEKCNVTIGDLKLKKEYTGYSRILIMDGVLYKKNLYLLGYEENWLNKKLNENNLKISDTLLFIVDEAGEIYFQEKSKK